MLENQNFADISAHFYSNSEFSRELLKIFWNIWKSMKMKNLSKHIRTETTSFGDIHDIHDVIFYTEASEITRN